MRSCFATHVISPFSLDRAVFRPWRPMSSRSLSGYARQSLCYYCCSADCWLLGLTLPIRRCQWACCTLRCVALHSRYTCCVALPPGGHVTLCMLLRVHLVARVVVICFCTGTVAFLLCSPLLAASDSCRVRGFAFGWSASHEVSLLPLCCEMSRAFRSSSFRRFPHRFAGFQLQCDR